MTDFKLQVFVTAAQLLNFTQAAKKLFISQPAVTKHIRELEIEYDTRLFEREAGKLSLTDEGKTLMEHAEHILEAYGIMNYEIGLLHHRYSGVLRLGASTTIAGYVLPSILARFNEKFPQVEVSLYSENSVQIEKALQDREIDLGLVENNTHRAGLLAEPFLKDELVLVTRTSKMNGKYAKIDTITPQELVKMPLVLRESGSGTLEVIADVFASVGIKLQEMNVIIHLGSTESIKHYLENADALGIVSIRTIERELSLGLFKTVKIQNLPILRDFSFVGRLGKKTALAQTFVDFAEHYRNLHLV